MTEETPRYRCRTAANRAADRNFKRSWFAIPIMPGRCLQVFGKWPVKEATLTNRMTSGARAGPPWAVGGWYVRACSILTTNVSSSPALRDSLFNGNLLRGSQVTVVPLIQRNNLTLMSNPRWVSQKQREERDSSRSGRAFLKWDSDGRN